jgi:hypothetical protein
MKNIIGTMVVLLLLTGQVMASPTMTFTASFLDNTSVGASTNPVNQQLISTPGTGVLEVVLLMYNPGTDTRNVSDINVGLLLTGTDAAKFVGVPYAGRTTTKIESVVGATYAFDMFDGVSTSAKKASGVGVNFTQDSGSTEGPVLNTIATGAPLAVFFFSYTGAYSALGLHDLTGAFSNSLYAASPKFGLEFGNASDQSGTVTGNGTLVLPEPATLSLVGLGLAALVARRRGAKK